MPGADACCNVFSEFHALSCWPHPPFPGNIQTTCDPFLNCYEEQQTTEREG